jgi:hypothetical protein
MQFDKDEHKELTNSIETGMIVNKLVFNVLVDVLLEFGREKC